MANANQTSPPRPYIHNFSRTKSSKAEEDGPPEETKAEARKRQREENRGIDDSMGLEERLERMDIDPAHYQQYEGLILWHFACTCF